jgi:hypothetical protein
LVAEAGLEKTSQPTLSKMAVQVVEVQALMSLLVVLARLDKAVQVELPCIPPLATVLVGVADSLLLVVAEHQLKAVLAVLV